MHELAPLISDLTVMLGVAGIVTLLFQRIRQPVVLGYLVAGMIIGPYITPHGLVTDIANIKILSELGVIFLMFSLGLEFSFHKLTKVGFSALITGLFDVTMMILLGYGAGRLMGWDHNNCLFLGAMLAISSTTIIFKAVGELGLKTKRFAEVIFGVLIVEDLLAILLLVALSTVVVTKNVFSPEMLFATIKLILVVGAWFLAGYFLVPSLFRRLSSYISQETLTIVSVALCLFLVSIAAYFHYSTALGAFIMGSILAETVLVHRIETLITPIRDIFGAIFFISVGMLINPFMIAEQWKAVLLITLVLMAGKVTVISIGTFLTGQSIKSAVRSGFGMAQIGEFSFIIATLGTALNVIDEKLYPIIVAVSSITTFTTPYMIRLSGHIGLTLEKKLPERVKYFLDSYSAWVYRTQTRSSENSLLRSVTVRLILNGIIVAIVFTLINKFVYPEIFKVAIRKQNAKMLSELIAILLSSPFIWGMLFSYKRAVLPEYTKTTLNPVIFLVWLITLIEIVFLSVVFFHTWITTAAFITLVAVYFAVAYRHLEKSYQWFEGQLIGNIKKQPAKQSRYKELAPWDTHFVEMEVGDKSPFIGKMLGECLIRQRYGVNIVAIHRGHHTILAPRGEERILDNDKLIVLGNDEQIDLFKTQVTLSSSEHEQIDQLENFALKPLLLAKDHPLVGKSIRDSRIRENLKGLVVGIERGNNRILNPDPETVLAPDDLLLIVGEDESMRQFCLNTLS
ncbi:cation:proton antiporter [Aquicella lusitana]|uniref:Transporter (CPA2 family) n=1 Tax=Aquicella lusitana TaxID=254246 RepID=A0A370GWZ2_9COXI|nr:cation:proton antiporter [Aquicella lusitana]RDI48071.1 transporter (CPA2 family) [Aquicella lusitana]VVC72913.1 Inner membrane protein YbaL [Aquicella lusitana]